MAAFIAISSIGWRSACAVKRRLSSLTKSLPTLPEGVKNVALPVYNLSVGAINGQSYSKAIRGSPLEIRR